MLILFIFISFVHVSVAINKKCKTRIDLIQALTKDKFLQNNHLLSEWFHRKYPTCTSYNDEKKDMVIGDGAEENVKVHNNVESISPRIVNDGIDYEDDKSYNNNEITSIDNSSSNDVLHLDEKNVVFDNRINIGNDKGRDLEERRLRNDIGRSLVSEWHEGLRSGTYILLHDVNITSTVNVDFGKALEITGIVGVDGIRPAIDGGGTPGCTSNCPGNRVFGVESSYTKLILTNLTIKNGYVCRYLYIFHFQIIFQ